MKPLDLAIYGGKLDGIEEIPGEGGSWRSQSSDLEDYCVVRGKRKPKEKADHEAILKEAETKARTEEGAPAGVPEAPIHPNKAD